MNDKMDFPTCGQLFSTGVSSLPKRKEKRWMISFWCPIFAILVFMFFFTACGANTLSDEEVLEKAKSSELEEYPGMVFATALAEAADATGIDWSYGWVSENKLMEPTLDANERPVHCSLVFAHGEVDVVFLNFIYNTEDNMLTIEGGESDEIVWNASEAGGIIANILHNGGLASTQSEPQDETMDEMIKSYIESSKEAVKSMQEKGVCAINILSLTAEDVLTYFGEPNNVGDDNVLVDVISQEWSYPDHGMTLTVYFVPDRSFGYVNSVSISQQGIPLAVNAMEVGDSWKRVTGYLMTKGFDPANDITPEFANEMESYPGDVAVLQRTGMEVIIFGDYRDGNVSGYSITRR